MESDAWRQQVDVWHERVLAIHNSTSWQITKPLRGIKCLCIGDISPVRKTIDSLALKAKYVTRPLFVSSIRYVMKRPKLRKSLSPLLKKIPWLHQRLLRIAINTHLTNAPDAPVKRWLNNSEIVGLQANTAIQKEVESCKKYTDSINEPSIDCSVPDTEQAESSIFFQISPYARQIYNELRQAVEQKNKGREL